MPIAQSMCWAGRHGLFCLLVSCFVSLNPVSIGFSKSPPIAASIDLTDADIFRCHIFREPLVPIGGKTTPEENARLKRAIDSYKKRADQDDHSAIIGFLGQFPKSAWRPALLTNLGLEYLRTGWFLKALKAWDEAWAIGRSEKSAMGKILMDRTVGELAELNARLGHQERVETILKEIECRPLVGPATEKITAARESFWMMRNEPGKAFKCGPFALDRIRAFQNPNRAHDLKIMAAQSSDRGMSLDQVYKLSNELGMNYQMAKRKAGSEVVVPSVVNWKANHYAALICEDHGRFLIHDPTFGNDMWVSKAALDEEASGYFLIPTGQLPGDWMSVGVEEAKTVWGTGNTGDHDPSGTKLIDDKPICRGAISPMAQYNFHTQVVSLNIMDTPVGYSPPRGPDMHFTVTYNQREVTSSSNLALPNFGPKWVCNWVAYLEDISYAPNQPNKVYLPGGGSEFFWIYYGANRALQSGAVLTQTTGSQPHYERTLPDGSQQVFDTNTGGVGLRRFYMTKLIDPAGQTVHFNYDAQDFRLISVTDALGQSFTISYLSNNPNILPDYYLIARVEDFAHRAATFEYQNGQLWKIHDAIGITSQFQYAPGTDFINSMTTPYGTTTFSQPASSLDDQNQPGNARVIQAVDQTTGAIERLEYGHNAPGVSASDPLLPEDVGLIDGLFNYRNSFYWDRQAMAMFPPDANGVPQFTKAKLIQWLHLADGSGNLTSNIKAREKLPLENAVYYRYPGQGGSYPALFTGTSGSASVVVRRLDDGSKQDHVTQLLRYEYNDNHQITKFTDPVGRITSYKYSPNNIDLETVFQRNPTGISKDPGGAAADILANYVYNPSDPSHLPRTHTDAAGMTTTYSYNPYGQLTSVQNAKGETTTYDYGDGTGVPTGYLASMTSPTFNGSSAITSFTYDNAHRVHTVTTGPDNYTVVTDYDALDRPTQVTYPDGTNQQVQYTDNERGMTLDVTGSKDRLNRWTYRHYNSDRQMDSITDPLLRTTLYEWCTCGALTSIRDPNGNVTAFHRDLQSRVISKVFADGAANSTSIAYTYEDTTSRLKSMTDALNQTTNYTYFTDDNLKQVSYTNAQNPTPTVSFTYDLNYNRAATMTDGVGTTNYAYYPITFPPTLGATRLESVNGPFLNDTINYTYDEIGRALTQSVNGTTASVDYDSIGRLGTNTNALGSFTRSYEFDVTSRLKKLTYPNGQTASYTYFGNASDRRLQTLQHLTGDLANLSKFNYTYDSESEIQTWIKNFGAQQTALEFSYDDAHQLTGVSEGTLRLQYEYDYAGNRLGDLFFTPYQHHGGNSYTANTLNQLDTVTRDTGIGPAHGPFPLTYDANGNMTADAANKTFEWDAANRLVAINYVGTGNRTEFAYDGLGRRLRIVEKEINNNRHKKLRMSRRSSGTIISAKTFVWCGNQLCEERDSTGTNVTKRFFAEGEQRVGGSDTGNYYYTRDHLGSIREVTDSTGAVRAQYDYDMWGNSVVISGNMNIDFGFTGHYFHHSSGLNLSLYRPYNPGLGRWISRDPLGERRSIDLYAYANNNPLSVIDPLGLDIIALFSSRAVSIGGHFPQGHIATLVGNNSTGWTYYSRNGYGKGPYGFGTGDSVLRTYKTYNDFKNDLQESSRYDQRYHIRTSADQDLAMTTYGDKHYRDPYHSILPPSNNCADLTGETLEVGGLPISGNNQYELYTDFGYLGSPEVPKYLFRNVMKSNYGHLWNVPP